jgi:hypothetical protein
VSPVRPRHARVGHALGLGPRLRPCGIVGKVPSHFRLTIGSTSKVRERQDVAGFRADAEASQGAVPQTCRLTPRGHAGDAKSRLRIFLGGIGRTALHDGRPRGGDPELPVAGGPGGPDTSNRTHSYVADGGSGGRALESIHDLSGHSSPSGATTMPLFSHRQRGSGPSSGSMCSSWVSVSSHAMQRGQRPMCASSNRSWTS